VTRQMYTCEHGRFVKAPKGYYRLEGVLIVGALLLLVNVTVSAGFAVIATLVNTGVTL